MLEAEFTRIPGGPDWLKSSFYLDLLTVARAGARKLDDDLVRSLQSPIRTFDAVERQRESKSICLVEGARLLGNEASCDDGNRSVFLKEIVEWKALLEVETIEVKSCEGSCG